MRLQPEALVNLGRLVVGHPAYRQRPDGTTFCNFAVQDAASMFGYPSDRDFFSDTAGRLMLANEMIDWMIESPDFIDIKKLGYDEANLYTQRGHLVIYARKGAVNGHVCFGVPGPMQHSGSYGRELPLVANVGPAKYTGELHLGWAFSARNRPTHIFLLVSS